MGFCCYVCQCTIMSFLPSSRPTLPPIRDVFPDELSSKVNLPFNSPFSTRAQPWSDDDEKARPLPAQFPGVHAIYGSSFRYSNTGFRDSALLHNHRLSHDMASLVRPDALSSFFTSPTDPHQVLPQNPFSANPVNPRCSQCSQSISTSTDAQYVEAFEPRSVACCNSDASSAFTHPPSFTHVVQRERRNSSANYECPYCGKLFNRPSSLKIHSNSHTGEKPFACPVQHCGRSFSVLSNMRRHARSHGSYAVTFTKSASDHYPLSLSHDLCLSSCSPIQLHDSHGQ